MSSGTTLLKRKPIKSTVADSQKPLLDYPRLINYMAEGCAHLLRRYHHAWPIPWGELILGKNWPWKMDVEKQERAYVVRAEAPGFQAEDFDIRCTSEQLVLKAKRKPETLGENRKPQEVHEEEYGQTLTLPAGINLALAVAAYKNDTLTVLLPKTEEGESKELIVKGC